MVRSFGKPCPVYVLCGLIRAHPAVASGEIELLVRRRRITGVRHEFILLSVCVSSTMKMWIRLERARATVGLVEGANVFANFPTKDTVGADDPN